ncbi:hypothetical protein GCM10022419_059550 [Nonomuraea rosea]|uniref:Uncharacterized protein n=1 Tax=Nonomuraea rosea TaxID=638574 RepID=A0ABP6XUH7_9ACTN
MTAVEDYFAQYGTRAPRLTRLYGDTVKFLVTGTNLRMRGRRR